MLDSGGFFIVLVSFRLKGLVRGVLVCVVVGVNSFFGLMRGKFIFFSICGGSGGGSG